MVGVVAHKRAEVSQVAFVHGYDEVEMVVVVAGHLPCVVPFAGNAVTLQDLSSLRVKRIAELFVAGGGGVDDELVVEAGIVDHIFEDVFGHGTAADIAEAYKEDFGHCCRGLLRVRWETMGRGLGGYPIDCLCGVAVVWYRCVFCRRCSGRSGLFLGRRWHRVF